MLLQSTETLELADFRLAKRADVDGLVDLYQLFFADSTLPQIGLEYDGRRMQKWLQRVIPQGIFPHIIATEKSSGRIIGSLDYSLDHSFTTRPYASLDKFYARREWRLSAVGRTLLTLAIEVAKADGAVAFRAGLSSGVVYSKNLFIKMGFRETAGSILLEKEL